MHTYDRITGDSKTDGLPNANLQASKEIELQVAEFLAKGGTIKQLDPFDRNPVVFNNQKTASAILNKCRKIKALLAKRGFSGIKVTYQHTNKCFYCSIDDNSPVRLGTYENARVAAKNKVF